MKILCTQAKVYNLLPLLYFAQVLSFNPCKLQVVTFYRGELKGLTDSMTYSKSNTQETHSTVSGSKASDVWQAREAVQEFMFCPTWFLDQKLEYHFLGLGIAGVGMLRFRETNGSSEVLTHPLYIWTLVTYEEKGKDLHPRLLYPARLSFRVEGQIKCFPDKVKLKEFINTEPLLYKMLEGLI